MGILDRAGSLFLCLPLPIVFIDTAGEVACANDRGLAVLGLPPGDTDAQAMITEMARLLGNDVISRGAPAANGPPVTIDIATGTGRYRIAPYPVQAPGLSGVMWSFHETPESVVDPDPRQSSTSLIQATLDQIDEGVMLIDPDDRIRVWNSAYLEMLDLPRALFGDGAPIAPLIAILAERGDFGPGEPADLARKITENIRHRVSAAGERQMANGRIIAVEWLPVPDGYFLFRLRDVTTDRMASRFKDELIGTVSHELRTPLTVISGALGLLRNASPASTPDPQAAKLINVAHHNSVRLTRLVNDLLDAEKLQSGTMDFQFEATDVVSFLKMAVEQNEIYARAMGIGIDLELPEESVTVEVDRGRLLQVMGNLLSNAAKFSHAEGRVRVRLRLGLSTFRISVIDRGRGMSEAFRQRLFTRFAQENRASRNGQAGSGLGLAICKIIVDQHRGHIQVDTQEGVGTIFHIDLPYHQSGELAET